MIKVVDLEIVEEKFVVVTTNLLVCYIFSNVYLYIFSIS